VSSSLAGAVGDRQRPLWAFGQNSRFGGVISEPAPEPVPQRVHLAGAKEQVVTGFAVQAAVAGVPVGAGVREVGRVDQWGVGVGAQQDGALLGR
jgi:hypothetical protein